MRGGGLTPPADHTAFPFPPSSLALFETPGHMGGGIAVSSLSSRCRESARQQLPELHSLCLHLGFPAPLLSNFISSFSCSSATMWRGHSGDGFAAPLGSSDLQPYAHRVSGKSGLRWDGRFGPAGPCAASDRCHCVVRRTGYLLAVSAVSQGRARNLL